MTLGRGRPPKKFPPELIQDIIYRYAKEQKLNGKIAYMEIYRYSRKLFEDGKIDYNIGEFFWRKGEGRIAIDKANQVMQHNVPNGFQENETFVDTRDAVNKLYTGKQADKEKLINTLKMNERKLQHYIKKCNSLEKKLVEIQESLQQEKEISRKYRKSADSYQESLFQWMELSMSKDVPMINLLTTGKTRTPAVTELLRKILSDNPIDTFHNMNQFMSRTEQDKFHNQTEQVVPINSRKSKSMLNDIDF